MNTDDLEQKLSRLSLRHIPAKWRGEILDAAISRHASCVTRHSFLSTLNHQLSTLLWPHPKAWAGLAAVWMLIFCLDFSMRDTTPIAAEKAASPSPEVMVELKQQQRMLAELIGSSQARDAESPRFFPLPRSERVEILMT
jgi:hypothetical protein